MAKHGDNHVITGSCMIVWDGVTRPENNDSGKLVHNLKLACPGTSPELVEIQAICVAALQADSKFKGNMPHGGVWPLNPCDPTKFEGRLAGMVEFNAKTYNGAPQVYDANGQILSPMVYGPMLYPGAMVQVIVHAYSFDNKSKGVALGLDGIRIVDATTPKLPVGGIDAGAAFGASAPPAGYPQQQPAPPAIYGGPAAGYPGVPIQTVVSPGYPPMPGMVPPPGQIQPAPDFLGGYGVQPGVVGGMPAPPVAPAPPSHVMTPAANGATYEAMIAAGWNDALLRQHGMML